MFMLMIPNTFTSTATFSGSSILKTLPNIKIVATVWMAIRAMSFVPVFPSCSIARHCIFPWSNGAQMRRVHASSIFTHMMYLKSLRNWLFEILITKTVDRITFSMKRNCSIPSAFKTRPFPTLCGLSFDFFNTYKKCFFYIFRKMTAAQRIAMPSPPQVMSLTHFCRDISNRFCAFFYRTGIHILMMRQVPSKVKGGL